MFSPEITLISLYVNVLTLYVAVWLYTVRRAPSNTYNISLLHDSKKIKKHAT